MARRFELPELVIATHNPGKLEEMRELMAPRGVHCMSAAEIGLGEPEETEKTFIGNALQKARAAMAGSGAPALADDSGLEVAALGGAPGIFSARWAGPGRDFRLAMGRIERQLNGNPDRRARFVSVLALAWPDGHVETFEGTVEGTLAWPARGTNGFGYDPMFVPDGHTITFGEMDPAAKHEISHRAVAFRKLVAACFG